MSFLAKNDQILIKDGATEVFNTARPMPHILQQLLVNGVGVTFPNPSRDNYVASQTSGPEYVNETVCKVRTVCEDRYGCELKYVCEGFGTAQTCGYKNVCGYTYSCEPEYGCEVEPVLHYRWTTVKKRRLYAMDWEQVVDLGPVPTGTNPDFLLCNVIGSRTKAGAQNDYGTFVSAIPNGSMFICQGSAILESAFFPGGSSWLRRIMSVYIEGDRIKAKFKHSNALYASNLASSSATALDTPPNPPDTFDDASSAFSFDFTIYVGRFTQ